MTCVKFTPDGTKLVTASTDNSVKVIDLRSSNTLFTLDHDDLQVPSTISKFAISPNGKYCVIGGSSGGVFIFNIAEGYFEELYDDIHNVGVYQIDWSPGTASTIATIDKSGLLYLWK